MDKYIKEMNLLRGLGILLVVLGHSIYVDIMVNSGVASAGFLEYVFDFIYSFHMPLFFLVSGFFSTKLLRLSTMDEYIQHIREKFMRLFLPYLTLTIIATPIKLLFSKYALYDIKMSEIIKDILFFPWNNPMQLLWYIYTLFFIFAAVPLLNPISLKIKLGVLFILNILPFTYGEVMNINGIIRYMFFFYLGMYFYQNYERYLKLRNKSMLSIVAIFILIGLNFVNVDIAYFFQAFKFLKAMIGIVGFVSLVYIINNTTVIKYLDYLGKYSYSIYLLHWFAQMPVRVFYQQFHLNYYFLLGFSFVAAFLTIPVSRYIIQKVRILNTMILGDYKKKISSIVINKGGARGAEG